MNSFKVVHRFDFMQHPTLQELADKTAELGLKPEDVQIGVASNSSFSVVAILTKD